MENNGWQTVCAHLRTGLHHHGTPVKCPHCQLVTYCSEACRVSEWKQHHVLFCPSIAYKKRLESRCELYVKTSRVWPGLTNLSTRDTSPGHVISLFPFRWGCISCEKRLQNKDFERMKRILNGHSLEQSKDGVLMRYELCPECLSSGKDICLWTYQNMVDCNCEISQLILLLYCLMNQFGIPPDLVRIMWFLILGERRCTGHDIFLRKEPKTGISFLLEKVENFFS